MALYINIYRTNGNWAHMKSGDLFVHEETLPETYSQALHAAKGDPEEYEYTIEEKDGVFTKINLLAEVEV